MNEGTTIKKWNYGDYSSSNYGSHTQAVKVGILVFYFSYDTIVAFDKGAESYCSENVWSTTTGKHLNWIEPDKKKRLNHSEFLDKLQDLLEEHKLDI